jgi:hypothetical protein
MVVFLGLPPWIIAGPWLDPLHHPYKRRILAKIVTAVYFTISNA